jgi:GMP synthase-like glutamine amidotransferase
MKPVAIFRFSPTEGPGHFARWLDAHAVAWQLFALDRGDPVPTDPRAFAGIGMMGGPMSANDDLPWNAPLLGLVREAVAADVAVIGHCLGGQLLARALGAEVKRAAVPEIGWIDVSAPSPEARTWFGGREAFTTFEWHYDTFALPSGAARTLTNASNAEQAYVIGKHIGFQGHIEMTREMVESWCSTGGDELPPRSTGSMQSKEEILRDVDARLTRLSRVADDVYARWTQGLAR